MSPSAPVPVPLALRLTDSRPGSPARALGLMAGDLLLAVDGVAPTGPAAAALRHVSRLRGRRVLAMQRAGIGFEVTADPRRLGPWEPAAAPVPAAAAPGTMRRWQVLAGPDEALDLVCLAPPALAALAPPVWLAVMRLWTALAACGVAATLALPFGLLALAGLWLVAGANLWRHGPALAIEARRAEGFRPLAVIAAPGEAAAQALWCSLAPGARFRFPAAAAGPAAAQAA
jgi:hypothetical protein